MMEKRSWSLFRREASASVPTLAARARATDLQLEEFIEPIMLLDADGGLIAANEAALALGRRLRSPLETATRIDGLLANARLVNGGGSPAWAPSSGLSGLDAVISATEPSLEEDVFELRSMVRLDPEGRSTGWVVRLIEVTPLVAALRGERAAASQRDQMLKLLSHDTRTPLAAILATLKHPDLGGMPANLREIIDAAAHKALDLIDSNVRLIRAQCTNYRFNELNFCHLLEEVIDTSWPLSKASGVKIVFEPVAGEHSIAGDRGSLTEAIGDLFAEFIRTSVRGRVVLCTLEGDSLRGKIAVTLNIQDVEGARMAQSQPSESNRAGAVADNARGESEEIGALDFFKTIISRHLGVVVCKHEAGLGRSVSITIPGVEPDLVER